MPTSANKLIHRGVEVEGWVEETSIAGDWVNHYYSPLSHTPASYPPSILPLFFPFPPTSPSLVPPLATSPGVCLARVSPQKTRFARTRALIIATSTQVHKRLMWTIGVSRMFLLEWEFNRLLRLLIFFQGVFVFPGLPQQALEAIGAFKRVCRIPVIA